MNFKQPLITCWRKDVSLEVAECLVIYQEARVATFIQRHHSQQNRTRIIGGKRRHPVELGASPTLRRDVKVYNREKQWRSSNTNTLKVI